MTRKRKRRSGIVEIGNGPARVKIYTMNRRDGDPEFTLAWKEAGRRKTRSFSSMDEARMIGQQISIRLTNGSTVRGRCKVHLPDRYNVRHLDRYQVPRPVL